MSPWVWLVLGIFLVAVELFVPSGFYLFMVGLSCVVVGLLATTGIVSSFAVEAIVFCVVAIGMWVLFGSRLRGLLGRKGRYAGQLPGQVVRVSSNLEPGQHGTGELWGTQWRLENIDSATLMAGSEAVVVSAAGVTLHVKRKH